jgi:hypothetical protein
MEPLARAVRKSSGVRNAITVRLPEDQAQWLETAARKTGLPKGRIVREELEKARNSSYRPFGNRKDYHHEWAVGIAEGVTEPLLTCEAALAETAFHLGSSALVLA